MITGHYPRKKCLFFLFENSCHIIIQSGDSTRTGEYWVDPQGNGNSFKAFCNMTTDGGTSVFFFSFSNAGFSLCCLQNRFFFQSIGGWMMMLNVILVSSQSSLWIGWLCVILPAIHSQRVKALTSGWVTKLASLTKKTTISCPASLKQNAGFIYADNPNRGKTNQNKFFVLCWKT